MEPTAQVIVGEQVAGQGKAIRKKAESLINTMETNQYDLGELLLSIQDGALYTGWGFNTYTEYMKTTKLKPSKARYLPQIIKVMKEVGIPRDQYEAVGIAKLRVIASLDPHGVYVHPITKAETAMSAYIVTMVNKAIAEGEDYSLKDLKKHVRTLKGIVGDRDITFFGFPILRAALDNVVMPCIERFRTLMGSVGVDDEGKSIDPSDGVVIERICAEAMNIPDEHFNVPDIEPGFEEFPQHQEEQ